MTPKKTTSREDNFQLLENILRNIKDEPPELKKPGIYSIKCEDCNEKYIGQTKNPLRKDTENIRIISEMVKVKNPQ